MFENIYDAEDYVMDYDIYTNFSIRPYAHRNYTGYDSYGETDKRKLCMMVEVLTDGVKTLVITHKQENETEYYSINFQYTIAFVIDTGYLYIGDKKIALKNLIDIYVDDE